MRLFIAAFREDEWPAAINEVLRVAKPGGMIQLMEYVSKVSIGESVVVIEINFLFI